MNDEQDNAMLAVREGDQFVAQKRFHEAIEAYDRAVRLAPHERSTRFKWALARAQAGQVREAQAELSLLVAIDPENAAYKAALQRTQARLSQAGAAGADEHAGEPVVLIVDDDEDVTRAVADRLQAEGWRPRRAHNLQEALLLGTQRPLPSAAVYDYCVGEITGLEVRDELSFRLEQAGLIEPPYVMLTARENPVTERNAVKQGACAYVLKSHWLDPQRGLTAAIRTVLQR